MSVTELDIDRSNVVDVDLGSAEFKANAHRHMAEWARRPPFYVLGNGPPQVVVGRYADVHEVFSDTETFASRDADGARAGSSSTSSWTRSSSRRWTASSMPVSAAC